MASSLSSSTCASAADLTQPLDAIQNQLNQRFQILVRIQSYAQQKSPELMRMFIRIIKHQIESQARRCKVEKQIIQSLKTNTLTKKIKKKLTDFSFSLIQKLSPSLNITIEKHYMNLAKIYESYFQSIYKFDYLKRITNLKYSNLNSKAELYISFLELLLQYVSSSYKNKLQATLDALVIKTRKSAGDVLMIKQQIIREREQQIKEIKEKETKFCEQKYQIRLPSLKCALFIDKPRETETSLSKKLNSSFIQVLGHRASNRPSFDVDPSYKELRQFNMSFKNKTDTSVQSSPNKHQFVSKHSLAEICNTQQKKIQTKPDVADQFKPKQLRVLAKVANPIVKVLQNKQDFLDEFSSNLSQLYKSVKINDLEIDYRIQRRARCKKQQWLMVNESRLVDVLVNRNNNNISKEISNYAMKYGKSTA